MRSQSDHLGAAFRTHLHGFASRAAQADTALAALRRRIDHWRRQATDRAISLHLNDLHLNPFLYLIESGH
jgi:hypothetical protein